MGGRIMPSIINASTSGAGGIVTTADASGTLQIQSAGATKFTIGSTGAYGTLQSDTAKASTSGTTVEFTSIPSFVKRITVMFNGVSTNGTSRVQMQIGGGSFTTSGYVSSGTNMSVSSLSQSSLTSGFAFGDATAAADLMYGTAILCNITGNTWIYSFNGARNATTSNCVAFGMLTLGSTLDRVRITTVNGTDAFDAGTINILYE
jgi:hypothetical protein